MTPAGTQPDPAFDALEVLTTGVLNEPRWRRPPNSTLTKLGKWMGNLFSFTAPIKLPGSFNWDDKAVVPAAGDQRPIQACISYASCLVAAVSYRIGTGRTVLSAPRVLHLCAMDLEPKSGTNSFAMEETVLANGIPYSTDPVLSGRAAAMPDKTECGVFSGVARIKVAAVRRFETADEVKAELCLSGPVVVHMDLYKDFVTSYVPGTVYRAPTGIKPVAEHAVCLIGFDDAKQCWIGVNSFGPSWGNKGRFLLKYGECNVMADGAAAYTLDVRA